MDYQLIRPLVWTKMKPTQCYTMVPDRPQLLVSISANLSAMSLGERSQISELANRL